MKAYLSKEYEIGQLINYNGMVCQIVSQGTDMKCFLGGAGLVETTLKPIMKGTKTVAELKEISPILNETMIGLLEMVVKRYMPFVRHLNNKEDKVKAMHHEFCIRGGDNTCRILSHFPEEILKNLLSDLL